MSNKVDPEILDLLPVDCDHRSDLYALVLGPKELRILFTIFNFPSRVASAVEAALDENSREDYSRASRAEVYELLYALRATVRDEIIAKRGGRFLGNTLQS